MKRGLRFWSLVAVGVALVAVVSWRLAQNSSPYFYPRPPLGNWSGGALWGTTDFNSRALESKAIRAALGDVRVRRILGTRYRVTGDWSEVDGVLLHIQLLGKPSSYELDLPYSSYGTISNPPSECRPPNFVVGWYHDRAIGVTAVSLIVNMRERRVVQIMTSARSHRTSWVPGRPHGSCPEPKYP